MIEKLGHTKRMQAMRKEWINEGKPKETIEDALISTTNNSTEESRISKSDQAPRPIDRLERPQTPAADVSNDDDLYSATPNRPSNIYRTGSAPDHSLFVSDDESGDHPPDDDLDLLLAEDSMQDPITETKAKDHHDDKGNSNSREDNFNDEMEALADMGDMW